MKVNQEVVDAIAEVLDQARRGEIQGFACVTLERDDEVGQCVAGTIKADKFKAIAAVEVLKRDLMDGVDRLKDHYPKDFKRSIRGVA